MNPELHPTVFIDGAAVRRIREEKKLTQLYVAKVVGVTTDTISRWENNRYPSIKRENALELAGALEVPVERLLRGEAGGEDSAPEGDAGGAPEKPRRGRRMAVVFLALLALIAGGLLWFGGGRRLPPLPIAAERELPNYGAPGSVVPVKIDLRTEAELHGFILREHFPAGWQLVEAGPPASSLDNEHGMARWIVRSAENRRRIAYLVKISGESAHGDLARFSGELVASPDGRRAAVPVGGAEQIEVGPYHWADRNGDQVIDDGEVLQAFDLVEEMEALHLDWETVSAIWDAGGYRWDADKKRFVAVKAAGGEVSNGLEEGGGAG